MHHHLGSISARILWGLQLKYDDGGVRAALDGVTRGVEPLAGVSSLSLPPWMAMSDIGDKVAPMQNFSEASIVLRGYGLIWAREERSTVRGTDGRKVRRLAFRITAAGRAFLSKRRLAWEGVVRQGKRYPWRKAVMHDGSVRWHCKKLVDFGWRGIVREQDGHWEYRLSRPDGQATEWLKASDGSEFQAKREAEATFRFYLKE